jgi:hypothetical protein
MFEMVNLDQFFEANKKQIVDFVEQKIIFDKLVKELVVKMPMGRDGITWEDKAHKELGIAIIHSMWCGWQSQAKMKRGLYTRICR